MKGIQEVYFNNSDVIVDGNVQIIIKDEMSEYKAKIDLKQLIYALKEDLDLDVVMEVRGE